MSDAPKDEAPKPKRPSRAKRDWLLVRQSTREALALVVAAEALGMSKTELVKRAVAVYVAARPAAVEAIDAALGPPVDD